MIHDNFNESVKNLLNNKTGLVLNIILKLHCLMQPTKATIIIILSKKQDGRGQVTLIWTVFPTY